MKIIVGLGNPGEEYRYTRHNTGWLVVDRLARQWQLTWQTDEERATRKRKTLAALARKDAEIILVKPLTFMNDSGLAVKRTLQINHLTIKQFNNLYIIHDDLDLPLGRIKIVKNHGPAGHKGMESVIKELGSQDFVRFRVGTGNKNQKSKIKNQKYEDYVLGEFKGEEKELWQKTIDQCAEAVIYALENGIERAMGKYNAKLKVQS